MTDLRKAAEMALEFIVLSSKDRAWFTEKEFEVVAALRQALAQPEQEPVAWGMRRKDGVILDIKNADFEHEGYEKIYTVPLYTAPPKREWVGLTDEEYDELMISGDWGGSLIQATEAKLKEKNT